MTLTTDARIVERRGTGGVSVVQDVDGDTSTESETTTSGCVRDNNEQSTLASGEGTKRAATGEG